MYNAICRILYTEIDMNLDRVKQRHIRVFVEIAQRKSISAAAAALNSAQPAVSRSLAELEDILGARLMERSRAGVTLTPVGEMFLHYAGASIAALRQGLDGVAQAQMGLEQIVRIGALPSVAGRIIPAAAARMKAAAASVTLSVISGPQGYLINELRLGRIDYVVGRLGAPDSMAGLSFAQLYLERVALVARPGHPLLAAPSVAGIADYPVIIPDKDAAIRPAVERLLIAHGLGRLPNRIESVSGAFGRAYLRQSDAVWLISWGVVALDVELGALAQIPVDLAMTTGPVGLTTRADFSPAPAQKLFEDCLRAAL